MLELFAKKLATVTMHSVSRKEVKVQACAEIRGASSKAAVLIELWSARRPPTSMTRTIASRTYVSHGMPVIIGTIGGAAVKGRKGD